MCPESVVVNASFNCNLYVKTENFGLSNFYLNVLFGDNTTSVTYNIYSYSNIIVQLFLFYFQKIPCIKLLFLGTPQMINNDLSINQQNGIILTNNFVTVNTNLEGMEVYCNQSGYINLIVNV
jgi:hypothetical protein